MVSPDFTWRGMYKVDYFPQACKDATASCFLLTFCSATCVYLKDRRKAIDRTPRTRPIITQGRFVYYTWCLKKVAKSAVLQPLRNWAKTSAMQPVKKLPTKRSAVFTLFTELANLRSNDKIASQVTNSGRGQNWTAECCWFLFCAEQTWIRIGIGDCLQQNWH